MNSANPNESPFQAAENAGDYTVDIMWQDGKVTAYRIASATPREVKVRINGATKTIQSEKQQAI